jgi:hypothetical protein
MAGEAGGKQLAGNQGLLERNPGGPHVNITYCCVLEFRTLAQEWKLWRKRPGPVAKVRVVSSNLIARSSLDGSNIKTLRSALRGAFCLDCVARPLIQAKSKQLEESRGVDSAANFVVMSVSGQAGWVARRKSMPCTEVRCP